MNDSTIAFRAKEQLGKFLGKVFTHFSKPRKKFLADMLYGIQASGDTQLSSIMRAINDDSDMRHAVEKRPSWSIHWQRAWYFSHSFCSYHHVLDRS